MELGRPCFRNFIILRQIARYPSIELAQFYAGQIFRCLVMLLQCDSQNTNNLSFLDGWQAHLRLRQPLKPRGSHFFLASSYLVTGPVYSLPIAHRSLIDRFNANHSHHNQHSSGIKYEQRIRRHHLWSKWLYRPPSG